jgi:hypothetical protein
MTKASKTKVLKKAKAKTAAKVTRIKPAPSDLGNILFTNAVFTPHLSEVMAVVANSRSLKGPVAYKVFLLCSKLDVLASAVRESITKIMMSHAKNPDPTVKFEVVDKVAYEAEVNEFLSITNYTYIPKFSVEDFANIGLSPNDYSTLSFLF